MVLAENKAGQQLLEFIQVSEGEALDGERYFPVTGAFAFIRYQSKYIIGYNTWREQWEFPAGKIEAGESPKACAIRELYEETGQRVDDLIFKGLFKVRDQRKDRIKYRAVYFAEVETLTDFLENDEMSRLMLWDLKEEIGYVDEVDLCMLFMCTEQSV